MTSNFDNISENIAVFIDSVRHLNQFVITLKMVVHFTNTNYHQKENSCLCF